MQPKKTRLALALIIGTVATGTAHASLTSSDPLTVYDSVQDINWSQDTSAGYLNPSIKSKNLYLWAVRPGNVAIVSVPATMPLPGAVWLLLSGMLGIMGLNRRKNIGLFGN
ncbi:hypothetical protein [Methylobacter sp. S3L5C]|uniref:hypothetical protein n=1 Tax=Methylobacter sp. S3L5C TaxID=2839024 RepID=UPI001FABCA91|nr:hypothetical protein [Methylobacter sp. S3L5C]UOA10117.1 hypothetical protein KKZ03_07690 [Methylobacter sp. S3L5C]